MKINNEAKIGMMVTIVVIMLVTLTVKTGNFNFAKKGYIVKVQFDNIDGIDSNAPVMLNGFEVGHVEEINIVYSPEGTKMVLDVWLAENAKLRTGAQAYVKNMGFLGEKYVGLTAGSGKTYLTSGAVIIGKEPADLDRLLQDGQEIATEIKKITHNLSERLEINKEAIDDIVTNMNISLKNIVSITKNLDERLAHNEQNIDQIFANLRTAAINLDQFTYDIKLNPWKLMYRSKENRERSIRMLKDAP